jgi:hypothetical protein
MSAPTSTEAKLAKADMTKLKQSLRTLEAALSPTLGANSPGEE